MGKGFIQVLFFFFLPLYSTVSYASSCRLDDSNVLVLDYTCYEKLDVKEGQMSLEEAMKSKDWQSLKPSNPFVIDVPHTRFWIRFAITNTSTDNRKRFIEFPDAHNSNLELFTVSASGKIEAYPAVGFDRPVSSRFYDYKNVLYDLDIPPGETQWFYVRIESRYQSSFIAIVVSDYHVLSYFLQEYYWLGIFYGILFIMAIYNLFIFVSVREMVYLYYVLYVFGCAMYTGSEDTVLFQIFWPEIPWLNHYLFVLSPPLLSLGYILYSTSFLEIRKKYPVWVWTCLFLVGLAASISLIEQKFFYKVSTFLFYIPFLIIYIIAIYLYKKGRVFTRFFIIGASLILISLTVFLLRKFNLIPANIYTFYIFNFAFVTEVIMFSYALADKFKLIKKDKEQTQGLLIESLKEKEQLKDKVNRDLEQKVRERTLQLEQQSQELAIKNEQLELMTIKLNEVNVKLDVDNWQLKKQVVNETRSRILLQEVSIEEFKEIFPDSASCYRFLEELKWGRGYVCKKCTHEGYMLGDKIFSRKCKKCKYNESVTANTLFQGVKFPIEKAFYITYRTFNDTDKITLEELSRLVDLRTATVWAFRKKVQEAKDLKRKGKIKITSWEQIIQ